MLLFGYLLIYYDYDEVMLKTKMIDYWSHYQNCWIYHILSFDVAEVFFVQSNHSNWTEAFDVLPLEIMAVLVDNLLDLSLCVILILFRMEKRKKQTNNCGYWMKLKKKWLFRYILFKSFFVLFCFVTMEKNWMMDDLNKYFVLFFLFIFSLMLPLFLFFSVVVVLSQHINHQW